jgi:hypothetical protein
MGRIAAQRTREIADAVAFAESGYVLADVLDHARRLAAQARRQRQLVEARAVIGVDEVQSHRLVPYENFARPRTRSVDMLGFEDLGPAGPPITRDAREELLGPAVGQLGAASLRLLPISAAKP